MPSEDIQNKVIRPFKEKLEQLTEELFECGRKLEIPSSIYENASKLIEPKYRDEFLRFTQTGEASDEFTNYFHSNYDNNEQLREAVDMVFHAQAKALEELGQKLRRK
ncbi:MAG: hypothetical protein AABY07_09530 [Nanoarchaeota archaeon]